jgi:hypothetical protein
VDLYASSSLSTHKHTVTWQDGLLPGGAVHVAYEPPLHLRVCACASTGAGGLVRLLGVLAVVPTAPQAHAR